MDFEEVLTVFLSATLGTPYHYGGDTPMEGYDCSGFVMEYLKMWGIAPPTDSSSDMIYDWFQADQRRFQHYKPGVGALVFYGKKSPDGRSIARISHIALMINDHQIAEAGGGDQRTLSKQEAINKKAFVRIRPYQYRKDMLITIMPTYPEWAKHPGRLRSPIVRNCPVNSSCVTDDQLLLPWYY
jgi:cell wall-associated NlpC family hydrolase